MPLRRPHALLTLRLTALLACVACPTVWAGELTAPGGTAPFACQLLADTRGIVALAGEVWAGDPQAATQLKQRASRLAKPVYAGAEGNFTSHPMAAIVQSMNRHAQLASAQQPALAQALRASRAFIRAATAPLLELTESVASELLILRTAPAPEMSAATQLIMLTQRMALHATLLEQPYGFTPESVFRVGKDIKSFRELQTGLAQGNRDLRLHATKLPRMQQALAKMAQVFEPVAIDYETAVLGQLQALVTAKESLTSLRADATTLDGPLQAQCFGEEGRQNTSR